jgi:hypothetical protein
MGIENWIPLPNISKKKTLCGLTQAEWRAVYRWFVKREVG